MNGKPPYSSEYARGKEDWTNGACDFGQATTSGLQDYIAGRKAAAREAYEDAVRTWLLSLEDGEIGVNRPVGHYEIAVDPQHAAGYAVFFRAPMMGRVIFPYSLEPIDITWIRDLLLICNDQHGHNWRQCPHCGELIEGSIVRFIYHTEKCYAARHQE